MDVVLEGVKFLALADSGSQVNMMMPEFIQEQGLSGPATGQTGELSPAFGWTWWLTHMSFRICNCKAPGQRGGRV